MKDSFFLVNSRMTVKILDLCECSPQRNVVIALTV